MSTIISIPASYALYEVENDVFEMITTGEVVQPPLVTLEVLALNGQAKRIGTVSSVMIGTVTTGSTEEDEDEDPPEGSGPWVDNDDEE